MLYTYNRKELSLIFKGEEAKVFDKSERKTGLEWNQYIGRVIINDFIKNMDNYEGLDFSGYFNILPFIDYGMFKSAIMLLAQITDKDHLVVRDWLIRSLAAAEDRYPREVVNKWLDDIKPPVSEEGDLKSSLEKAEDNKSDGDVVYVEISEEANSSANEEEPATIDVGYVVTEDIAAMETKEE